MYLKSPAEMAQGLRRGVRGAVEHAPRRGDVLGLQAVARQPDAPLTSRCRKGTTLDAYFRHVSHEGLTKRFDEFRRAGKKVDEVRLPPRLETELEVHRRHEVPRVFLDRLGTSSARRNRGRFPWVGPRLRRGLSRRLLARHHDHRSDSRTTSSSSAFPEPGTSRSARRSFLP